MRFLKYIIFIIFCGQLALGLPSSYDRSPDTAFPPIGSQSGNTCAGWASTYYSATYLIADLYGWNPTDGTQYRFSPPWTYNMVNGGTLGGSLADDHFLIQVKHGLATWSEFYPSDLKTYCTDPAIWRNAIKFRMQSKGAVANTYTDAALTSIKEYLVDGNYGIAIRTPSPTYGNWKWTTITSGPYAGEQACYYVVSSSSLHHMAIVGYNDDIWIDVNKDGLVSAGEMGAFKIADSHGTSRGNQGFYWLAYDATKTVSAVPNGPTEGRTGAFWQNKAFWVERRPEYTPELLAEFTLQSAARGDIRMKFHRTEVGDTPPTTYTDSWTPGIFSKTFMGSSERIGFDGKAYSSSASAPSMTFVFDLTDIAKLDNTYRYVLELGDIVTDKSVTLSSFKLTTKDGDVLAESNNLPITADNNVKYAWIDYGPNDLSCSAAGGICKTNACYTYTDCTSFTGTCATGNCCSGTCVQPKLISHWKFDEGSGTTATDSVGINDGTIVGATYTTGKIGGYAIYLDGIDDYVDILESVAGGHSYVSLSEEITITAWINPSEISNTDNRWRPAYTVIELRTQETTGTHVPFSFGVDNGKILIGATDDYVAGEERFHGNNNINADAWYHIAFTITGDQWKLFLNGQSDGNGTFVEANGDRAVGHNIANMQIGARSRDSGEKDVSLFKGAIDDLKIYNYALTGSEIQNIYESDRCGPAGEGAGRITRLINSMEEWKSGSISITELLVRIAEWKSCS